MIEKSRIKTSVRPSYLRIKAKVMLVTDVGDIKNDLKWVLVMLAT